jgi:hypothetical protein
VVPKQIIITAAKQASHKTPPDEESGGVIFSRCMMIFVVRQRFELLSIIHVLAIPEWQGGRHWVQKK